MVAYNRIEQISLFFQVLHDSFHCLTHVWRITSRDLKSERLKVAVDWASKKNCRKFGFAQYFIKLLI